MLSTPQSKAASRSSSCCLTFFKLFLLIYKLFGIIITRTAGQIAPMGETLGDFGPISVDRKRKPHLPFIAD